MSGPGTIAVFLMITWAASALMAINELPDGIGHFDYIDRRSGIGERSQENVARR